MTLKERLLAVAATYASARGLSTSRVSTLAFGDGKVLDRLAGESDLTTSRFEASMWWFSANWPEGEPWPADVPRPAAPQPERAA